MDLISFSIVAAIAFIVSSFASFVLLRNRKFRRLTIDENIEATYSTGAPLLRDGPHDVPVEWMSFRPGIEIGDSEFARIVKRALDDEGVYDGRLEMAAKLRGVLFSRIRHPGEAGPVLEAKWTSASPERGWLRLRLLPGFGCSSRMFLFAYHADHPLTLLEVWWTPHPAFRAIDPASFVDEFKIALADPEHEKKLRAAVLVILGRRNAPMDPTLFPG